MKERPILFSGPMVRALLNGSKTQTRRVVKPRGHVSLFDVNEDGSALWSDSYIMDPGNAEWRMRDNPYGQVGDRLWVREAWAPVPVTSYLHSEGVQQVVNPNDPHIAAIFAAGWDRSIPKWKPSIHMPRWASRLTLEITDIRVERLQDISEADAMAEGIHRIWPEGNGADDGPNFYTINIGGFSANAPTAVDVYRMLWEWINGDGSWAANPWVWVVSFEAMK